MKYPTDNEAKRHRRYLDWDQSQNSQDRNSPWYMDKFDDYIPTVLEPHNSLKYDQNYLMSTRQESVPEFVHEIQQQNGWKPHDRFVFDHTSFSSSNEEHDLRFVLGFQTQDGQDHFIVQEDPINQRFVVYSDFSPDVDERHSDDSTLQEQSPHFNQEHDLRFTAAFQTQNGLNYGKDHFFIQQNPINQQIAVLSDFSDNLGEMQPGYPNQEDQISNFDQEIDPRLTPGFQVEDELKYGNHPFFMSMKTFSCISSGLFRCNYKGLLQKMKVYSHSV